MGTSNAAYAKLERAKRHLLHARLLLQSLPARYWTDTGLSKEIDTVNQSLIETQEKVKTIKDPGKPRRVR